MRSQERIEREINLKELFWSILLGWRQIICFAIIFAIFLGGVKFLQDMGAYNAAQNVETEDVDYVFTDEEEKLIADAKELTEQIAGYENYLESSVLLQMNPYKEPIIKLQYRVNSDYIINYTKDSKRDYTEDIMNAYYQYLTGGNMGNEVIKMAELPISQENFSELRAVYLDETSLTVAIIYPDEEELKKISESIKILLKQMETEFQKIGSHKLDLIEEAQNIVVDAELREKRTNIINNTLNLKTQLNTLKANMTEEQLNALNRQEKQNITTEEKSQTLVPRPMIRKKYLFLGAFSGGFLVCIWIACRILFTAKLQNAEEIRTFYNSRLLGEISVQSQKKRFLSGLDNKLLAIKNRRKKKLSIEQQIKVISANVALSCKKHGIDCVYMTGSEYENVDSVILDMLKKELYSQEVQIREGGNIFYDAESLKQGTEIGNILFVEQKGRSIYDEISNELNLAKEQNNYILGFVVLV